VSDGADPALTERAVRGAATVREAADPLPETPAARRIETGLRRLGDATSWLWLVLLGGIVLNVVLRYAFSSGRIELEELQWHLYATGFLVGLAYCMPSDAHIRVDVLRDRMAPRTRAWIELYGLLLLLLPFVVLVVVSSVPFVAESWRTGEVSASPGGLPGRVVVKAVLPLAMAAVGLGAVARILRVGVLLFGGEGGHPDGPRTSATSAPPAAAAERER